MARSTFYYLKKYAIPRYDKIKKEIFIFNENKGRYGYRITLETKNRLWLLIINSFKTYEYIGEYPKAKKKI